MPLDFPIHARTLSNGLRVVVSEDHAVPSVALNLWVEVGSRDEVPGRTGLAHLFEHLMFEGSEQVGEGEHMASLMAVGGRANATTSFDRTAYVETVPTGALELALWLEADRHGHLLPAVTQANLDNQREVVVEEKRQRYDTVPYGEAFAHVCRLLFPADHPYHHPTIGSMEDLAAADLDDVHAFFRTHYGPATTILTLVGDVDPGEAVELAERHLGALTAASAPRRPAGEQLPPLPEPVELELREHVPSQRLYLAWRLPAVTSPEFLPCAMALDALASLSFSRLYRRIVRGEELVSLCSASALGLVDGASLALLVLDVEEGVDPARVEAIVHEELVGFARTGPSDDELEASRADTERSWLEAMAGLEERAELLSRSTALLGDPQRVNTYLDEVLAVTGEQVREAAERWLAPGSAATVRYLHADEETSR